ncbi:hypothetical protein [Salininema proteolyticum]|uniref:Uncharacterized protein n=1 Tax=Salininema proteolyticum TaxID=1607685 RepID=A0ABV8TXW3_9ACTN
MIIGSLSVLVSSAILLVTGVVVGNDHLLTASIAASVVSALFLYVGAASVNREETYRRRTFSSDMDSTAELARIIPETPTKEVPVVRGEKFASTDYVIDRGEELPPRDPKADPLEGEPGEQKLSSVERAQIMRLNAEVMVIDGRPRFHHSGCVHLVGRESEPLAVAEAVTLGFGPCVLCEPATRLLGGVLTAR